ncbi:bacitracin ABC transporter ATP-binding protein [Paenibacillus stellifer]|uniref:Bacitracin ABC transporter ATP-binding protein n=1 Tax=Paenibacillus stellifer TaxID=169760 RepID=A0A089LZA0_9BACL|nr:ATP-binding cassette domain-containing protein [Paenibacillus stellifer]AIQ65430.1 bacitracin ABC transporter ATP-binding protein [Paenibacillus stellifer]
MGDYVLEIENLTKRYKKYTVLEQVSLRCKRGHVYGLIGVNGAGKSTLMKCITGLSFQTEGTIRLFGQSVSAKKKTYLTRIGCMIESPAIDVNLTAKENIKAQRLLLGIPNETLDDELLEIVGLGYTGKKKARDFSLGMKQRLGIALALVASPELLILDEPINGLDPIGVVEIRQLLRRLCVEREMTIIVSSHNLPELYQTATDYIFIHQGKLVKELTLAELDNVCKQAIVIRTENPALCVSVLEDVLRLTEFKVLQDGTIKLFEGLDRLGEISTALVQNGAVLTFFGIQGDTLENYFLSIIGGEQHV